MRSRARSGVALVKAATVYLLVGLLLGMAMAAGKDYRLVSVYLTVTASWR